MSLAEEARRLLAGLTEAGVAFIVVGGSGALMQGVPMVTFDLDIVPSRDAANVERLLAWLLEHRAHIEPLLRHVEQAIFQRELDPQGGMLRTQRREMRDECGEPKACRRTHANRSLDCPMACA